MSIFEATDTPVLDISSGFQSQSFQPYSHFDRVICNIFLDVTPLPVYMAGCARFLFTETSTAEEGDGGSGQIVPRLLVTSKVLKNGCG